ncbi:phosphatidylinositol N-acetylglucosaminyltransferase subunit Y-like [Globicephala melas]|uniref:phosphatidylinositol N-acetylglucosaminyltransferase subunit Y-like n=1 Tax=Globicephala melas TaxID=9731 RepID=UPI00122EDD12|nr:phosphatidylinositol N-acetylglucosaminyltransferase subunit Y-like [Globicephala melas]XP_060144207.1 phosphatidylinositol N-acetylglucosaminyltransferase subunit Y-like [Globicephala melas]
MFLPLSTLTALIPLVSLAGLLYSAFVVCSYSLLLLITIPVYVFFHLWTWMGIKLFRQN